MLTNLLQGINPAGWVAIAVLAYFAWSNRDKVAAIWKAIQEGNVPDLKIPLDNPAFKLSEEATEPARAAAKFPRLSKEELDECLVKFQFMASQITAKGAQEACLVACGDLKAGITAFIAEQEQNDQ